MNNRQIVRDLQNKLSASGIGFPAKNYAELARRAKIDASANQVREAIKYGLEHNKFRVTTVKEAPNMRRILPL